MRKIRVFKIGRAKQEIYVGSFHRWVTLDEGTTSVLYAVVEQDNGFVELVSADKVQFVKDSEVKFDEELD